MRRFNIKRAGGLSLMPLLVTILVHELVAWYCREWAHRGRYEQISMFFVASPTETLLLPLLSLSAFAAVPHDDPFWAQFCAQRRELSQ